MEGPSRPYRDGSWSAAQVGHHAEAPEADPGHGAGVREHPTGDNQPRVDAHKVRTQAYSAMLAGAAGHAYGSLDLFWFSS
jgi:hypothetical protein